MLWDLYQDMKELQEEIDRLFEHTSMWPSLYYITAQSKFPPLNIREDADNLYLDVSLPGMDKDKIQINMRDNTISISGEKTSPEGIDPKNYYRRERITGHFIRTMEFPMDVEMDNIKAEYENGILVITFPKIESVKPIRIEVKIK